MWYVCSPEDPIPTHASQGNPSYRWFWERQEGTRHRLEHTGNNALKLLLEHMTSVS